MNARNTAYVTRHRLMEHAMGTNARVLKQTIIDKSLQAMWTSLRIIHFREPPHKGAHTIVCFQQREGRIILRYSSHHLSVVLLSTVSSTCSQPIQKCDMTDSINKQFISFKLHTILKAWSSLHHPVLSCSRLDPSFVQHIHALYATHILVTEYLSQLSQRLS